MSLHETQRRFAAGLLSDDPSAIESRLGAGRFGARRHWQIYRNNVYASLTDALEAVYPVVARLVGADCFQHCGHDYVRYAPPAGGNLHDFGAHFAEFLASFAPVRALAYLPDVARLEWAWHCAFHAADAADLALDALAQVPPARYGTLRFHLHPSVHLMASDYPLLHIWRINQPDVPADDTVDLREGGEQLLIARRGLTVEIESIRDGEYALLRAFERSLPFSDAAAAAAAAGALDLTACLRERVGDRTIVGFDAA